MGVKWCDSVKRKHKGSLHIFFVIICNTDCGFKLKAWCVWFDLFSYCKECSGLLTIITLFLNSCFFFCCGLTIISLHNLPYNYCLMCVCVLLLSSIYLFCSIHYFKSVIDFCVYLALRSMCLISYRCFILICQLFTERTGRCTFFISFFPESTKKKERHRVETEILTGVTQV